MKNIVIELKSETPFEFVISKALNDFIIDIKDFYWIDVYEDKITVSKQGYNTSTLEKIILETRNLVNNILKKQIRDAIISTYQYTFAKTGDLTSRIEVISTNPDADSHWGASHAFYVDRTGKYPEYMIVKRIALLNEITATQNDYSTRMHK